MLDFSLRTHLLREPDEENLAREARRINMHLGMSPTGYRFPIEQKGNPVEWKVSAEVLKEKETPFSDPSIAMLCVRRKTSFPWKNYFSPEFYETWAKPKDGEESDFIADSFSGEDFTMTRNMALVLPSKRVALDLRDPLFRKNLALKHALKDAGYSVLRVPDTDSVSTPEYKEAKVFLSTDFIHEETFFPFAPQFNYYELHFLMRNRKSLKPLDERAQRIIMELTKGITRKMNVPAQDLTYHLVKYVIRVTQEEDNYMGQEERIEKGLMSVFQLTGDKASSGNLERHVGKLPPSYALGIRSHIDVQGRRFHIPMMDFYQGFRLEEGDGQKRMETAVRRDLRMPGILVDSGKSAHFYGFNLLTEEQWSKFMDDIQRFSFVDTGFVNIQRESGSTILRITPAWNKVYQPCFYKVLEAE